MFALRPRGDGHLRFEPAEGGRLIATLANGKEFEVGCITVWKPGEATLSGESDEASLSRSEETLSDIREVIDEARTLLDPPSNGYGWSPFEP